VLFDHVHHRHIGRRTVTNGCNVGVFADDVFQVLLWALYFDNFPHGHYGTIRQQVWSLLHFPFQLAIVGVVEGSQQIALARYVTRNADKVAMTLIQHCQVEHLDGQKLKDSLMYLLDYFELNGKFETSGFYEDAVQAIHDITSVPAICSPEKTATYADIDNYETGTWPRDFMRLEYYISNGMYIGLGMKVPVDKLEKYSPLKVALGGWKLVYLYYWSSFCLLIACLIIFLILIRRHKADLFDFTSIISRSITLGIGGAMLALISSDDRLYAAISSPALLPMVVTLLFLLLVSDKLSALWCNWRLKKSGKPYALEYEEHGHHNHGHSPHGSVHETGALHGHVPHDSIVGLEDMRKAGRWSTHPEDMRPLTSQSTEYNSPHQSYAMEPLMSPPMMSPDPVVHQGTGYMGHAPAGYAPVSTEQNFGA
jgi:hypothetical protein